MFHTHEQWLHGEVDQAYERTQACSYSNRQRKRGISMKDY